MGARGTTVQAADRAAEADEPVRHGRNEVIVAGRVAAAPSQRALPSGDELVTFRVVVDRPPAAPARRTPTVDTIDCAAWTGRCRRSAARLDAGDVVEITGSLRRRFWRAPTGPVSRTEVEVATIRVLSRASRAGRVSRARSGASADR
jgi:single-strand DNA-binding protein